VRRAEQAHDLEVVILRPATVYGPGSTEVVGGIARAIRGRNMLLVDGGRAVAGLCYVDKPPGRRRASAAPPRRPGHAFNVTDGLDVTWREFTDGLAHGLGCSRVRWSLPYWIANGVGFSLEHGYRMLRKATGLHAPPLLSRQAVHVLGRNQDFQQSHGARGSRLGAARRILRRPRGDAHLAEVRLLQGRVNALPGGQRVTPGRPRSRYRRPPRAEPKPPRRQHEHERDQQQNPQQRN